MMKAKKFESLELEAPVVAHIPFPASVFPVANV